MSAHASDRTYWLIAIILAVITALEVAYPFVTEGITALNYYYMPILAVMSAMKFFLTLSSYFWKNNLRRITLDFLLCEHSVLKPLN